MNRPSRPANDDLCRDGVVHDRITAKVGRAVPAGVVRAVPAAITLAGMIATPLARRGGPVRRVLSTVVVSSLFATTAAAAQRRWGTPRTATAATGIAAATAAVEHVGAGLSMVVRGGDRVRPETTFSTEGDPGPRPQGARREHARRHVTDERRRDPESRGGRMPRLFCGVPLAK